MTVSPKLQGASSLSSRGESTISQLPPYLKRLFVLVSLATLFEALNTMDTSLVLPYIGREFRAGSAILGHAMGLISFGAVLAFFPIRMADRYGRKPVFVLSVVGYTLFTLASAFSRELYQLVWLQMIARMFLVTEVGLAYVILSEEMPPRIRGRMNALMFACGVVGTILATFAFREVIHTVLGWRALYLLSGVLIPLLPVYWTQVRETGIWKAHADSRAHVTFYRDLRRTLVVFRPEHLRSTIVGTALMFTLNFWTGSAVFWFNFYVLNERQWTPEIISRLVPVASIFWFIIYFLTGPLMDYFGRKKIAISYLTLGGLSTIVCFTTHSSWIIMMTYTVIMALQGLWSVAFTIISEIFPTEVRTTGAAVISSLIGRVGMVIAGFAVGEISARFTGTAGSAIALVALVNFLCIPVLVLMLRETRGCSLC